MSLHLTSDEVRSAIKEMLKRKEMTYADLARELGVSLSTIKRILTSEEIGLERLFEICAALSLTPEDLIKIARSSRGEVARYTEEEDAFFAANLAHFRYFTMLLAGKTSAQIAARYGLTRASNHRYLCDLAELGVIRKTPQGKVHVKYAGSTPVWAAHGKLQQHFLHGILEKTLHHFSARLREFEACPTTDTSNFSLHMAQTSMRKGTYLRYIEESEALFRRYREIARLESQGFAKDLVPTTMGCFADTYESVLKWRDEILPDIPNLK